MSCRPSLSWTWVVRSQRPAARVSAAASADDVGVAGVEGQGDLGSVELGDQRGEVGHPAPGVDARRHVLDAERRRPSRAAWSASVDQAAARASRRASASSGSERPPGWTTRQDPPAAASQSTHRFRSSTAGATGSPGRGSEVDPRGPDRLAPPAAVGAVDRQAGVGDLSRSGAGSGKARQSGRISRTAAPSRRRWPGRRRRRPGRSRRRSWSRGAGGSRCAIVMTACPCVVGGVSPLVGGRAASHDSGTSTDPATRDRPGSRRRRPCRRRPRPATALPSRRAVSDRRERKIWECRLSPWSIPRRSTPRVSWPTGRRSAGATPSGSRWSN